MNDAKRRVAKEEAENEKQLGDEGSSLDTQSLTSEIREPAAVYDAVKGAHLPMIGQQPTPDFERPYRPRTPLGARLWEIRQRVVASGEPLLSREEIEQEVENRRSKVFSLT
jgi:hypothetical protein